MCCHFKFVYLYILYVHAYISKSAIVRYFPILGVKMIRARKRFLAFSADKQTCNYDTGQGVQTTIPSNRQKAPILHYSKIY